MSVESEWARSAVVAVGRALIVICVLRTCVASAQPCASWRQVADSGPSPRASHAMAYDRARGVTVLFDGEFERDTWEWDGIEWRSVSTSGPPRRFGHAMAYDSARQLTVLFGGYDVRPRGDGWGWDGRRWREATGVQPTPRYEHAMAYDSGRRVIVLFGGADHSGSLGDTWEWDGVEWKLVSRSGPWARSGHAMAYDSRRGVTVLFGGYPFGHETWEWNGIAWQRVADTGPPARDDLALVYDSQRGVSVLFGGDQTWEWDGILWEQVAHSGPSRRGSHAMAYDSARGVTVLFGGKDRNYLGDTWEYDCVSRIRLTADGTCPGGGPIRLEWSGATPRGLLALGFSREEGRSAIPPGLPCAGAPIDLSGDVSLIGVLSAGRDGRATVHATAGPGACGGFLQLLDLSTCIASNVARVD